MNELSKLKIVAIGGGHGLGRVLSTLSFMEDKLTGIVATTDNGGSTGRLRKRTSSIAWGDLRNCLIELVQTDSIASKLFNFRFEGKDELSGHNLGNLILSALSDIKSNPLESINLVRNLLQIQTQVLPMSESPTDLMAFSDKGRCYMGELSVDDMTQMPKELMLAPLVKSLPPCIKAINEADIIILGPGSFLTSIIPPLLVRDISKAIRDRKGQCIFIDNLEDEDSPAASLTLDERLIWMKNSLGFLPVDTVITQSKFITSQDVNVVCADLADKNFAHHHDTDKLIKALTTCIEERKVNNFVTKNTLDKIA
jgi:uncharacterized cofD-like protein|tara:strand:- start:1306 stop:2238 length:933 start_codon:yes stop_codon:yes gene_type:complete